MDCDVIVGGELLIVCFYCMLMFVFLVVLMDRVNIVFLVIVLYFKFGLIGVFEFIVRLVILDLILNNFVICLLLIKL